MSDYRRARDGSTYFFAVVTYKRQPILCLADSIRALKEAIKEVKEERPFEVKAWVLLPDTCIAFGSFPKGIRIILSGGL